MDYRKQITKYLLFYFLIVFPFGQLFRIGLPFLRVTIQPIDLTAIFSLFLLTRKDFQNKFFNTLLILGVFGLIFSLRLFSLAEAVIGLTYFLRFIGYIAFFINLKKIFIKEINLNVISKSLVAIVLVTAVFGWVQYILLPDFRSFKILGWDDHWFRLIGTFFDPGFTGIIFVLGFLLSLGNYLKSKSKLWLISIIFIGISIAFTYSRASYLSLLIGSLVITTLNKNLRIFVLILVVFVTLVFYLPRPASSGVQLERTFSIDSRVLNYKEGIEIFKASPVFGIGFNNLCQYKIKYLRTAAADSHSCGGLDSSLIFILATTGIVGFMILGNFMFQLLRTLKLKNSSHQILLASLAPVLIHSQFTNSLFYPWVVGYIAVLAAIAFSRNKTNG